jgi:hydroxymethylglutaryl-CoA lyase
MKILVTPRDAMQGIKQFIPTEIKTEYINTILNIGFDIVDFGSFVSPKAIPQMSDTAEVLKNLNLSDSKSKLLSIIGNLYGARTAAKFPQIKYFGFPFSSSPAFLKRNINAGIEEAYQTVEDIQNICVRTDKELIIYFSMAFGNPYGDPHNENIIIQSVERLRKLGIKTISLADTVGVGNNESIANLFTLLSRQFTDIEFGLHLHVKQSEAAERIDRTYKAGCRFFDTSLLGMGGCPMSGGELLGNLSTEQLAEYLQQNNIPFSFDIQKLKKAVIQTNRIFQNFIY